MLKPFYFSLAESWNVKRNHQYHNHNLSPWKLIKPISFHYFLVATMQEDSGMFFNSNHVEKVHFPKPVLSM